MNITREDNLHDCPPYNDDETWSKRYGGGVEDKWHCECKICGYGWLEDDNEEEISV